MTLHRLIRYFALGNFAFAAAALLSMAILLQSPETSFAQTTDQSSTCVSPSFYSFKVTPANLNSLWSLPLLSTIDGPYAPTVTAKGLPPGIELQDQKSTIAASNSILHVWVLSGAPTQLGTYTITVTAQNTCGGASSVITLPINNSPTAQGSTCPAGTSGTYPNCIANNTPTVSFDKSSLVVSTSNPTITGTSNTAKVSLVVQSSAGKIYASPLYTVSGGRWSIPLSNLSTGTYALSLYDDNNTLLIPGTLVVAVPSPAAATRQPIPTTTTLTPTVGGGVTNSCIALQNVLRTGSRGAEVAQLQNFLISKGLLSPASATGYFGPLTRAAVQQLQASAGIVSSGDETSTGFGLVGARTRALIGCQSLLPVNMPRPVPTQPPAQTYTPVTSLPSCPRVPQPLCPGGTLISLGVDENHCSRGAVCQSVQLNRPAGYVCPTVITPSCTYGDLVSSGYDSYGCSMGYQCQRPICDYVQQITSCPAGQTLVSGTDRYGCPNVSYCSGTPIYDPTVTPYACLLGAFPAPDCPAGTHAQGNTDAFGCPAAPTCVPDTTTTSGAFLSSSVGVSAVGGTVTFTGSNGQSNLMTSEIVTWLDYGDGVSDSSLGSGAFTRTHIYYTPGTYTVKLQTKPWGAASSNFITTTLASATVVIQ